MNELAKAIAEILGAHLDKYEQRIVALETVVFGGGEVITGTVETTVPAGDLDTDGLPWNEEFHASTKGKNNDGRWTRIRITGADKESRKATNDAAFEAWKAEYLAGSDTAPVAPVTPAAPAAPSVPAAPAAPAAPVAPAAPAAPATPTAPATNPDRVEMIKQINQLNNEFKVSPDLAVKTLYGPYGVDNTDKLPETAYKEVARDAKAWIDYLKLTQDHIDRLDAVDQKTNGQHSIMEKVVAVLINDATSGAKVIAQVDKPKLAGLYDKMKENADTWVNWFNSQSDDKVE